MVEITMAPDEDELASSSSFPAGWKYDVFLSFRGEDTRKTFVDHLYSALKRSGIFTFKDDERLETGESISPALLKAIEDSSFALVVFSKNYASSRWCLDELVKIMDCRRHSSKSSMGQTVFPIFYDVEPSDVRKPDQGYFGKMIRQHDQAKVEMWRKALGEAASLSGSVLKDTADGHESKFIEVIVEKIWRKLRSTILRGNEGLVGMKSRMEAVTLLLGVETNVVRTVGIWGLSGIGKSTLAGAVYDKIKYQFDVAHFLENVGETSKKNGLKRLQENLLSITLGVKDLRITNAREGIALMKTRLRFRRVLLVLDDVDNLEQLEALAGSHDWFGPGSRIMITTRDKHLLVAHNVDKIHEASVLEDVEATNLFHWKAFSSMCPTKDFEELSIQVILYAGGLPLALKIFGSALRDRDMAFWESALVKLRKEGPEGEIVEKLKIGFNGLEKAQKETFLDIACFFEGEEKEYVERKLDSFEFYPNMSIPILVDRSLIYCSNGRFCMHQLIREMGRRIVRRDFPREPGKHSRLWDTEEIELVLANSTGTENIEGILLYPREPECITIEMGSEAFRKMTNLRLLEIHNASICQSLEYLPDGIRWIVWDEYPSNSLPTTFKAYKLVGLEVPRSSIQQLWKGRKMMDKLKYLNLARSQNLIETPDFTGTPNLETLILEECRSLVVVHQSLGSLKRLVCLKLSDCLNLKTLPNSIPSKSLQNFELTRCSKLQKLPEIPVIMKVLSQLRLGGTAIRELPSSIEHLPNLVSLILRHCRNLASLPSTVCRLKCLKRLCLSDCSKLDKLPEDLGCLERLEELDLDETAIKNVPSSIEHLSSLVHLSMRQCKNIQSFPSAICKLKRLKSLSLTECSELDKLPEELGNLECLEKLFLCGSGIKDPSSIGHLSSLVTLGLRDCKNIRSLPSAICKLKCLKRLYLSGCSELEKLPEELGSLEYLEELDLDGTAITQPPLSVRCLNNLRTLNFRKSSQSSRTSLAFPFWLPLKRKRQEEEDSSSTTSLVLFSVSGLHLLKSLDVSGCNMLNEAIPGDLELLWSLERLNLSGNCFDELSSLNKLSRLSELYMDGCKKLEALPKLPSSIRILIVDDCPSLRLSADRFANTEKVYYVSFRDCLQLLKEDNGESKNIARTLWQHMIEGECTRGSIILPGRDIPEWFCQTKERSISLKLPPNWSNHNFKGYGFCVAFDPTYKPTPFPFSGRGKKVAGVRVEIIVRTRSNYQYRLSVDKWLIIGKEKNISKEHVCLAYLSFGHLHHPDDLMNDWCEMEVSIKYSSPNAAVVTKWGMGLVPNSQGLYNKQTPIHKSSRYLACVS